MESSFDILQLKKELQGDKGLIKIIRKSYMPDTSSMSKLAQDVFEESSTNFSNIDYALEKLLKIEYDLFIIKQNEIINRFIEFADKVTSKTEFPNVRRIIDDYKNAALADVDKTSILSGIINISINLADSNRQSRVSRSGSSLMHHISFLLEKNNFEYKKDYQREFVLKTGCKLDFFFPNLETYNFEPKNCCAVACQTTSNDRFRLTFAQMPSDTRNRACTAIGSSNFGDKLGPQSLTQNKLDEAKQNGVKFVILHNAIDKRLRDSKTVISYQDWFDELTSIRTFW